MWSKSRPFFGWDLSRLIAQFLEYQCKALQFPETVDMLIEFGIPNPTAYFRIRTNVKPPRINALDRLRAVSGARFMAAFFCSQWIPLLYPIQHSSGRMQARHFCQLRRIQKLIKEHKILFSLLPNGDNSSRLSLFRASN